MRPGTILSKHPINQFSKELFSDMKLLGIQYGQADFQAVDPPAVRISGYVGETEVATYIDVEHKDDFKDKHTDIIEGLKQAMINNELDVPNIIEAELEE